VVSDATGGHDPTFHEGVRRGAKAKFAYKFDVGGFYAVAKCGGGERGVVDGSVDGSVGVANDDDDSLSGSTQVDRSSGPEGGPQ
jgi:hypothetical protein